MPKQIRELFFLQINPVECSVSDGGLELHEADGDGLVTHPAVCAAQYNE